MRIPSVGALGTSAPTLAVQPSQSSASLQPTQATQQTSALGSDVFTPSGATQQASAGTDPRDVLLRASFSASESQFTLQGNGFQAQGMTRDLTFQAMLQEGNQQVEVQGEISQTVLNLAVGGSSGTDTQNGNTLQDVLNSLPADPTGPSSGVVTTDPTATGSAADSLAAATSGASGTSAPSGTSAVDSSPASLEQLSHRLRTLMDHSLQQLENGLNQLQKLLQGMGDFTDQGSNSSGTVNQTA
jgi:hypothetical protein